MDERPASLPLRRIAVPVAALVFLYLATSSYATAAIGIAGLKHFWVDEVLAVWVARLPTVREIAAAIWQGAEFSPPTYDVMLHVVFGWFGSSLLVARLPSILAVLWTAAVLGCIVRPRLGPLAAALTFGLVLNSALFDFAVQARPYGVLVAVLSTALLLWCDDGSARGRRWRPAAIALLLFASVSLHFYAVVNFAVFGLMEALRTAAFRAVRPAIWLAIGAGAGASAAWLPLMRQLARFNSGDTDGPEFYGAPTLQRLSEHAYTLLVGSQLFHVFILAAVLAAAAACVASFAARPTAPPRRVPERQATEVAIMAAGLLSALPAGFALALAATGVFSARYALAASLGGILLLVLGLDRLPFRRAVGVALCALLSILPLLRGPTPDRVAEVLAALRTEAGTGPVVVSDGNLFMELMEGAEPAVRARLVHLARPPAVRDGDMSAEHQLQRLRASFRPDLPVLEPYGFMAAHPVFTQVCRPAQPTDAFCSWLVSRGWAQGVIAAGPQATILTVRPTLEGGAAR